MSVAETPIQPVPPQAKVDPESLVLRAQPMKAIRFRRGAIIGIAALGSASLMGVAWMALKPQVFRNHRRTPATHWPACRQAMATLRDWDHHCRVISGDRSCAPSNSIWAPTHQAAIGRSRTPQKLRGWQDWRN